MKALAQEGGGLLAGDPETQSLNSFERSFGSAATMVDPNHCGVKRARTVGGGKNRSQNSLRCLHRRGACAPSTATTNAADINQNPAAGRTGIIPMSTSLTIVDHPATSR